MRTIGIVLLFSGFFSFSLLYLSSTGGRVSISKAEVMDVRLEAQAGNTMAPTRKGGAGSEAASSRMAQEEGQGAKHRSGNSSRYAGPEEPLSAELRHRPTDDKLTLNLEDLFPEEVMIEVFDLSGMRILQRSVSLVPGENLFDFNLAYIADGIYFFKIITPRGEIVKKFSKHSLQV